MAIRNNGYVGIGCHFQNFPLQINNGRNASGNFGSTSSQYVRHNGSGTPSLELIGTDFFWWNESIILIFYLYKIWNSLRYLYLSDSRIKDNIEDVPDNLALQQVQKYSVPLSYKDVINKESQLR